ncbi:MAG: GNAT family N-acetyltransferase [Chloroflexi bacterium]|nr:GNAT family N-acetyltransferase [Chloroflexota bacterium]
MDKDRILAFTAHTWGVDEDDYIRDVFDDWLADQTGEFTAALIDDQVVAIAKLTDLGNGEWWFEGLRVDPDFRRRGIASALNRYHVDLARQLGGKVIRYMTAYDNVGSQTIGAQSGFQHTVTFAARLAAASDEFDAPTKLTQADVLATLTWLDSPLVRYQYNAFRDAWSVQTMSEAAITRAIAEGRAFGLKTADGRAERVAAWAVVRSAEYDDDSEDNRSHRLRVDHLDGEPGAVIELARQLRGLAARLHRSEVSAGVSDYAPLIDALTQAGYQINPEHFGLWIMELAL